MSLLRYIFCFFQVLLFTVLGASVAFASAGRWHKAEFPTYHFEIAFQHVDLAFAARAPPSVSENVAITGTHVHGNGDVRAFESARSIGVATCNHNHSGLQSS